MHKKLLLFLAILMLPLTWVATLVFFKSFSYGISSTWWHFDSSLSCFIYGVLGYVILHYAIHKPHLTYVFGHELTHAIWGKLFFAKVSDFTVTKQGGHVRVSKDNFLITLAPYFFPIYTVFTLLLYYGIVWLWPEIKAYVHILYCLVGISWSFHIIQTVEAIRHGQSDLTSVGRLFSLQFIVIVNYEVFKGVMHFVDVSHGFKHFNRSLYHGALDVYGGIWHWVMGLF